MLPFDYMSEIFRDIESSTAGVYPPYNIVKNGDSYTIELAVAGFSKEELDIFVTGDTLTIKGEHLRDEDEANRYVHRGIARRKFECAFVLGKHTVPIDVDLKDGLLSIYLKIQIPESKQPKRLEIKT